MNKNSHVKPKQEEPLRPPKPEKIQEPLKRDIPPFIEPEDLDNLKKHLTSNIKSMEVEVSFGLFKNTQKGSFFEPGVSVNQFNRLLYYLSSLHSKGIWSSRNPIPELEKTFEESENGSGGPRIKKITDSTGTVTWQSKQRHTKETIDNKTWGYRISKSTEKIEQEGPPNFTANFWREKQRRSFLVTLQSSELYGVQFDLTVVKETKEKYDYKTNTKTMCTNTKYEVEIERKSVISYTVLQKAIEIVIQVIQNAQDASQLLSLDQREGVVMQHNILFSNDEKPRGNFCDENNEFYLRTNYWNKPENIKPDDMLNYENKFAVTVKIDGVRRFILITKSGIFSCLPPRDLWKIGGGMADLNATLLDTEEYTDSSGHVTYYAFDILFYKGEDVRKKYFTGKDGRLVILKDICSRLKFYRGESVKVKNFYHGQDFYQNVSGALKEAAELEKKDINLDGLIFQSHVQYKNFFTKKWKPSDMLTIDFKLSGEKDEFTLLTKTPSGYEPFKGSKRNPFVHKPNIYLQGGILKNVGNSGGLILNSPANGAIVECHWNYKENIFVPVRYRDDKEEPNFNKVAADVWDDIINPISKDDIEGNTLLTMRRFHNLVKKHFLKKEFTEGDTIMDWGSGRGGDIGKWKEIGFSNVFAVEPNPENFEEFERRLVSIKLETEGKQNFPNIVAVKKETALVGAEETSVIEQNIKDYPSLNGIVSFFSLTFFGKDKALFGKMIKTIDATLPVGGKFLGIVMDGEKVQKLLEQDTEAGSGEGLMFDCPAFSITQNSEFSPEKIEKGKNEIEIVIKEPTSMVNQVEWLFYFSALKKSLENIGFVLKYEGFLDEKDSPLLSIPQGKKERRQTQLFNLLNSNGKTFSSLNRYFMFERISTDRESSISESVRVSENFEFDFDFLKTFWGKNIPTGEDKVFSLIRPVPEDTKYGIIHAILYPIDSKYRESNLEQRIERVNSVLRMMATTMSFDLYKQAMRGPLYDRKGEKKKQTMNLEELKTKCEEFRHNFEAEDEVYMGILSHLLKINIMSIEVSKQEIILDSERKIFGCYENTILVLKTPKHKRYETMTYSKDGDIFMAYSTKSPFIRRIIELIAHSKKFRGARMEISK